ncbi:MAG: hypothetical protein AAB468_02630 [Patescibacteria group bacterium]
MPKKNVSIDDLAVMVKHGFDGVDQRFDAVDKRFDAADEHFIQIEARLDRIENLILREHQHRLERLEDFMRQTKTALHIK